MVHNISTRRNSNMYGLHIYSNGSKKSAEHSLKWEQQLEKKDY